jgi:hypothetical protein
MLPYASIHNRLEIDFHERNQNEQQRNEIKPAKGSGDGAYRSFRLIGANEEGKRYLELDFGNLRIGAQAAVWLVS